MSDEQKWKQRFLIFAALRVGGLCVMFLGIAIALTDLVRQGGFPLAGWILAAMGLVDAIVAPQLMRRHWKQQDEAGE